MIKIKKLYFCTMLSRIRNSYFLKVFWGLMGIYLLNISVDTADFTPENIPEDLTINDQESIIEIVVEKILGFENGIKECDDNDTKEHNNKKNTIKIDFLLQFLDQHSASELAFQIKIKELPFYKKFLSIRYYQLETPPPRI